MLGNVNQKKARRNQVKPYKPKPALRPGERHGRARVLKEGQGLYATGGALERRFDVTLVAELAQKEKQIQQNYRPVIGVHKWFARRPGALFRALFLAEFAPEGTLREAYFRAHNLAGRTLLDPFMGGGTPLFEANRLGMSVIGCDVNPMAYWIVHQELAPLDRTAFRAAAEAVLWDIDLAVGSLYRTSCTVCGTGDAIAKYFLWVKQQVCAQCRAEFDLSPGPLIAENERHPAYVFHCPNCQGLTEEANEPTGDLRCRRCRKRFTLDGTARRNRYTCPSCGHQGRYPHELAKDGPPRHRLFAIEYHCSQCKPRHSGRFFKTPDAADLARFAEAERRLGIEDPKIPDDPVIEGAETKRLHRWGYHRFRDLFNDRQLLGLSLLTSRIRQVQDRPIREALATVFSDALRYQNMLCRYDTMALKCQDIFAVHGFPVGLVQCENNLLGIPSVGTGGFRHFVEKYDRAKAYCEEPFETVFSPSGRKRLLAVPGERIAATFVDCVPPPTEMRLAWLRAGSVEDLALPRGCLDGVFTDPPYYDNVQYAELMDFCYVWLRHLLREEVPEFRAPSTRTDRELTGNKVLGRGLDFFTQGLSRVFCSAARALKSGAPFVFTYHHNDLEAYAPVCVALLDAGLLCTAVLPAPAEMEASIHINGTESSTVDSVIVARRERLNAANTLISRGGLERALTEDAAQLAGANIRVTRGDITCLALGLVTASANRQLLPTWQARRSVRQKLDQVRMLLMRIAESVGLEVIIDRVHAKTPRPSRRDPQLLLFGEAVLPASGKGRKRRDGR